MTTRVVRYDERQTTFRIFFSSLGQQPLSSDSMASVYDNEEGWWQTTMKFLVFPSSFAQDTGRIRFLSFAQDTGCIRFTNE